MGGDTATIKTENAARGIIEYARKHSYTKIIVGKVPRAKWLEIINGTLADNVIRISGDIDVYVVTGEEKDAKSAPNQRSWEPLGVDSFLAPIGITALITMIAYPFRDEVEALNTGGFYLIGVVWLALRYGHTSSFIGAVLAAIAFDFFLLSPFLSFTISEANNLFALIIMAFTGLIIAQLTSKMRLQTIYAQQKEEKTAALYALSKELTATRGKENLVNTAAQHIGHILNADISVWLPDKKGELQCFMAERPEEDQDYLKEASAANWCFTHKQPAGLGTETLPNASGYYIPMVSGKKIIGVVGLLPENKRELNNEQISLLDNIVNIIATAVARANSAEMVESAVVESEGEKLRNIILSSVSHDLRTPLASISGAASTLLMEEGKISKEYSSELLRLIHEEAARLARMVTNLLDVTSLQSGSVKLNKELYFIEELIGSAIMRMESRLGRRHVDIKISQGMPLILMDGLLIEQTMINLLENTIDHTPDSTHVKITAEMHKPDLHVIMQDNGPGIPEGEEEHIFDRFYADGENENIKEGRMGLAICRGIITAHDGKIWAQNNPEGGAIFTFTLPLRQQMQGDE